MKVVAFMEPPQAEVIEKILGHRGLWREPNSRAPPDIDGLTQDLDSSFSSSQAGSPEPDQTRELTYVDIDTFLASF